MIYFYKTKKFQEALKNDQTVLETVNKKIRELSKRNKLEPTKKTLQVYGSSNLIWILKNSGQIFYRVIIQGIKKKEHQRDGHELYIVRDAITINLYEPYWRGRLLPQIKQQTYLKNFPLEGEELKSALAAFYNKVDIKKKEKPFLPNHMRDWLIDFSVDQKFDIYESPHWHKKDYDLNKYYPELYNIIKSTVRNNGNDYKKISLIKNRRKLYQITDTEVSVICEIIDRGSQKIIFLHSWFVNHDSNNISLIDKAIRYPNFNKKETFSLTKKEITKGAYRGYPSTIFFTRFEATGRSSWEKIQNNSAKSNLALAPEQEQLLSNCVFPQFINGQAGSGKSEMLLYLFAEMCFRKAVFEDEDNKIDIVFLTENEELLNRSKKDTYEKLQNNSKYQEYASDLPDLKELDNYFYPFIPFIVKLLPEEIQSDFNRSKYVNFAKFKHLYETSNIEKNLKAKYPAEIVWYVIMTFIRGYSSEEEEFTPEDFENKLNKKEAKITYVDNSDYAVIFHKIWKGFYKKIQLKEGLWDRISIVRKVLKIYSEIPKSKKYDIIVCDEAQDFTRIELELLVKLSKYGDYKLLELDNQIPILFAGDPFQTVNPTGFNLRQIKQIMYGIIEKEYGAKINRDDFINDKLTSNYRSSPEIVNTSNIIQYIRKKFLDRSELKLPQTCMNHETSDVPILLELKPSEFDSYLEKFGDPSYIVPCNYGEENEYKNSDNFLKKANIICKSPSLAKGSEYPNVIVYKFGDHFCEEFGVDFFDELLNYRDKYKEATPGIQFKLNYFFNKLYVAVSRAQEKLFILDTPKGIKNFWTKIEQSKYINTLLSKVNMEKGIRAYEDEEFAWKEQIDIAKMFMQGNLFMVGDIDPNYLLQSAYRDMEDGIIANSQKLLEHSIINFRKYEKKKGVSQEKYINKCLAYKAFFDKDYMSAYTHFKNCVDEEEFDTEVFCSDCLWICENYSELIRYHSQLSSPKMIHKNRTSIARIISNDSFTIQVVLDKGKQLEETVLNDKYSYLSSKVEAFYTKLIANIRSNINSYSGKHGQIAQTLKGFKNASTDFFKLIAELYFEHKDFENAKRFWNNAEYTEHRKYWKCGAEINKKGNRSEEIYFLNKLGDQHKIIENFDNLYYTNEISRTSFDILIDLLLSQANDYSNLIISFLKDKSTFWKEYLDITLNKSVTVQIKTEEASSRHYLEASQNIGSFFPVPQYLSFLLNMSYNITRSDILTIDINSITDRETRRKEQKRIMDAISTKKYLGKILINSIKIIKKSKVKKSIFSKYELNILRNLYLFSEKQVKDSISISNHIAFIDNFIPKPFDKAKAYAGIKGFLLCDDRLNKFEIEKLEERFWKARYEYVSKRRLKEDKIEFLATSYKQFPYAKLTKPHPKFEIISNYPTNYSFDEIEDIFEAIQDFKQARKNAAVKSKVKFLYNEEKDRLSRKNVKIEENSLDRNNIKVTGAKAGDIIGGPIRGKNISKALKGARFLLLSDSPKGQPGNLISYFKILDEGRGTAEDILFDYIDRERLTVKELLNDKRVKKKFPNLFYTNKLKKLT